MLVPILSCYDLVGHDCILLAQKSNLAVFKNSAGKLVCAEYKDGAWSYVPKNDVPSAINFAIDRRTFHNFQKR